MLPKLEHQPRIHVLARAIKKLILFAALIGLTACGAGTSAFGPAATLGPTATPEPRKEGLEVKTFTSSSIRFDKGDYVWVIARGEISMGPFVGYVGPDGVDNWMLMGYNIVRNAPHGGLLCRLKGQTEWAFCGSDTEFQPDAPGELEFQINDRDQGNNGLDEFFQVGIFVAPYSVRSSYMQTTSKDQSPSASQSSQPDTYQSDVPAPNDVQDCYDPEVAKTYEAQCSLINDRDAMAREQAEQEAERQRQWEEERQKADEQRANMP